MPDYSNGKIYTIRNKNDDTKIYVGSTIQPLYKRFGGHKASNKLERYNNCLLYLEINNDWSNWYIELYENFPCGSKEELHKREGEIIRLIGTLNNQIAGRSIKEWRDENIDKYRQYQKEYNEENKEKISKYHKEHYKENIDKIKERSKEWRDNNKEYQKKYYEENKEEIIEKQKEYFEKNKEKIIEKNKESSKNYRNNNTSIINEKAKQKIYCVCGCLIRNDSMSKHKKSKKHNDFIVKH
jgi:hypothetical protein